ncbi:MAG TPA: GAF domain-containing protein, partial [Candidatus Eisenbacteria bacterium]|nr:GAF domain-containing protein [Candidatus Eisenbacteria bacterium]
MGRFTRHFVVPLLVLAVPLGILAGLGFLSAERQLARTRENAIARTVDAVTALVADYQQALERETLLLARDPAVVEGTAKGDWATLARGASPRVLAVTQDGLADFIAIRDGRGAPLVQVPAGPPPSLPGMPPSREPTSTLRLAGGRPYFLVVAPISGATERAPFGATGTVVAGRRLDGLATSLDRLPARPAVLFLAGDRALVASRPDLPAAGWTTAAGSGALTVAGEPWALRRLETPLASSPDGALWVALSVRDFGRAERRLLYEFLALVAGGAVVLAGVVLAFLPPAGRSRPVAGPRPENPRVVLERRNRELEALNAIATTIGRGANLETTARETLEVVRGLAGMDVGSVYQVNMAARELIMVAGSGFDPRYVETSRVRPLDGSRIGDAVLANRILVTHLDAVPPAEEGLRRMAAERAHRTQLAMPIPVEQQTWGVMALVSQETREFSDEEMKILSSVA